jgi:hypothetical protein
MEKYPKDILGPLAFVYLSSLMPFPSNHHKLCVPDNTCRGPPWSLCLPYNSRNRMVYHAARGTSPWASAEGSPFVSTLW